MMTEEDYVAKAGALGASHGTNAARWQSQYLPGGGRDTGKDTVARAREALREIAEEAFFAPEPPLRGEWAGTYRIALCEQLGVPDDGDECLAVEVCAAYENEFQLSYEGAIVEFLQGVIRGE